MFKDVLFLRISWTTEGIGMVKLSFQSIIRSVMMSGVYQTGTPSFFHYKTLLVISGQIKTYCTLKNHICWIKNHLPTFWLFTKLPGFWLRNVFVWLRWRHITSQVQVRAIRDRHLFGIRAACVKSWPSVASFCHRWDGIGGLCHLVTQIYVGYTPFDRWVISHLRLLACTCKILEAMVIVKPKPLSNPNRDLLALGPFRSDVKPCPSIHSKRQLVPELWTGAGCYANRIVCEDSLV
jgi:hypothetical protein